MSSLANKTLAILLAVSALFIYILLFKSTPQAVYEKKIMLTSSLVKLPAVSLSTSFHETRVLEYGDFSNEFYLDMKKDDFSGFVYAK